MQVRPRALVFAVAVAAASMTSCAWADIDGKGRRHDKPQVVIISLDGAQPDHVERYLREVIIPRTAPITPHMILNFLAEKVLDLPKSY